MPSPTGYCTGEKGVNRVRAFADPRTGLWYLEYRADGRKARTALKHRDAARARAQADELAARLRRPSDTADLSLATLFDNYLGEVTPTKGPAKQAHDRRTAKLILEVLGGARRVADLTHRDAHRFLTERKRRGDLRKGATRPLRARALGYDIRFFKAVLTWGVNAGLLIRSPLAGFTPPTEASPRRPVVTAPEYQRLLAVADSIHPTYHTALILAHETGHRIGAVRHLQWADIDWGRGIVKWQAEHDKLGFEHETILTETAVTVLREARRRSIISPWVLPSPTDPSQPVSRHLLRDWWERGEVRAKLTRIAGRGWHSLRRQFATELKHAPLRDVAALGGWKTAQTILTCYQQPDEGTMRQALASRQRLEA